jgi:hypothetical protein
MINRTALLNDLQDLLVKLQEDLRTRCAERPEVETPLRAQYDAAREAKRTAESYESWREDQFAQATVAWILSCVFIRFLEDNGLLGDTAYLSGPGPRLALARDQHALYFRQHPMEATASIFTTCSERCAGCPAWHRCLMTLTIRSGVWG